MEDAYSIPADRSPLILEKIIHEFAGVKASGVVEAIDARDPRRLSTRLNQYEIKRIAALMSWVFNFEPPTRTRKLDLAEFIIANYQTAATSRSVWTAMFGYTDTLSREFYSKLAQRFGVTWLYAVDLSHSHFIDYQYMVNHPALRREFSPFYEMVGHLALFRLPLSVLQTRNGYANDPGEKGRTVVLTLPEEVHACLFQHQTARLLVYCFYEYLNDSNQPTLTLVNWEDQVAAKGAAPLDIFVNGVRCLVTAFNSLSFCSSDQSNIKRPERHPCPIDLTAAVREIGPEYSQTLYLDFGPLPLPRHPNRRMTGVSASQLLPYMSPYFSIYLAAQRTTEDIRQELMERQFLTTAKFRTALEKVADSPEFKSSVGSLNKVAALGQKSTRDGREVGRETGREAARETAREAGDDDDEDDEDSGDFEVLDESVSLLSSITLQRLTTPIRGEQCRHFNQAMELGEYIQHCQNTNLYNCLICGEPAPFSRLHVDAYILYLLQLKQLKDSARVDPDTGLPIFDKEEGGPAGEGEAASADGAQAAEKSESSSEESGWGL